MEAPERSAIDGPRSRRSSAAVVALSALLLTACQGGPVAPDGSSDPGVIASGFGVPDAIAVIGDDEFLLAERSGALHHYRDGTLTDVAGLPVTRVSDVYGGLLDVSLHPDFSSNRLVYIAYNDAGYGLTVARFAFQAGAPVTPEVIYESSEFSIGSRIEWQDQDHFFLSFGIGGDPYPDPGPQDMSRDVGKIHRLTADGGIPTDNPVFAGSPQPSSVWSYGHRNPQGLHYEVSEQKLYAVEHGPLGGDELNEVVAGGNYGWPIFSYGLNYDQTSVSALTESEADAVSILPTKFWTPQVRVAPSGLLRIENGGVPAWEGSFLLGSLRLQNLMRYDPVTDETEILLSGIGRVRDVARLPSGELLISVDAGSPTPSKTGRVIKLTADGILP